jgi:hypothetical protein
MPGTHGRRARTLLNTPTPNARKFTPKGPDATQRTATHLAQAPAQERVVEALIETKPRRGDHVSSADFQWQRLFLAALRENCNVRAACEAAGVSRVMAYRA